MTVRATRIMQMIRESYRDGGDSYRPHYAPAPVKKSSKGALAAAAVGGALLYNALPKKRLASAGHAAAKDWVKTGDDQPSHHATPAAHTAVAKSHVTAMQSEPSYAAPQHSGVPATASTSVKTNFRIPTATTAEMHAARNKEAETSLPAGTKPARPNAYILHGAAAQSPDDHGAGERNKAAALSARMATINKQVKTTAVVSKDAPKDATPKVKDADRADGEGGYTIMKTTPKKGGAIVRTEPETQPKMKLHKSVVDQDSGPKHKFPGGGFANMDQA